MKPIKSTVGKRKTISVSENTLVQFSDIGPSIQLPLVVEPTVDGVDLMNWVTTNQEILHHHLLERGGLLFRGFGPREATDLEKFVQGVGGDTLAYRERSSPRSQISGNIYTSTDHPADQPIFLHNENSYSHTFPLRIYFCSIKSALVKGATPIADCRRVYERIDPRIRTKFMEKHVMYVRNFGDGFGLPWQTVFQSEDKRTVEAYCREVGLDVQWKDGDRLRTRRVSRAAVRHPLTGAMVWFNHATFFHVTTLTSSISEALRSQFAEDDLPTNSFYGDGSPIEPEVLDHLREVYHQETVRFSWQDGDVLMLDNMLTAHGREPYEGERRLVVAMSDPLNSADLSD
jgi:hypothetical protein